MVRAGCLNDQKYERDKETRERIKAANSNRTTKFMSNGKSAIDAITAYLE
jgi:hypothetical protein